MTIWLLEGTECVGKSTAAETLSSALHCPLLHFGPPKADNWVSEYLYPVVREMYVHDTKDIVMDRGLLSDIVWAAHLRRGGLITKEALITFKALGMRILVLERDVNGILKTLEERGEMKQADDAINLIHQYRVEGARLKMLGMPVSFTSLNKIAEMMI